ncbi:hypothetical protein B7463_g5398, partial [Scytalidium lignicola]
MSNFAQKPPQLGRTASTKGTGFEEPLCKDRNTTLPHPDADTSENACIEVRNTAINTHRHHILPFQHHHKSYNQSETLYDSAIAAKSNGKDQSSSGPAQEVGRGPNVSSAPTEQRNGESNKTRGVEAQ